VFLNFVNYVRDERQLLKIVDDIEDAPSARVTLIATGPTMRDVRWIDRFHQESRASRRDKILTIWRQNVKA